MNRSRLTVIAALVAVLAIAAGVVVFTMGGGDDSSTRQRNAALDNKLDASFGTNGLALVSRTNESISIVDVATTPDGTTYMLGNTVVNGARHAFVRRTSDGRAIRENWVVPRDNYSLDGWASLKETVGIALSVDGKGNVWILADGYHAVGNSKSPFLTQLKPDLTYFSDCGPICGGHFASWSSFTDVAINPQGDRLIVVGSGSSIGFKPTLGKDFDMGYGPTTSAGLQCPLHGEATRVVANDQWFFLVNSAVSPKSVARYQFSDFPWARECTSKLPLETVSDLAIDGDGSLYAYGRTTAKTVGYIRMQPGAMDSGTGQGFFSPKMPDVVTTEVFPGGVTVSSGTLHMAAAVNSLNGPKAIIEYVVRNNSFNISTALDSASKDLVATTPPLLTRHDKTLTLVAPTLNTGASAAVMARFNAAESLVGAPEWPLTKQTVDVNFGSTRGLNIARPLPNGSFSLDGGSLPTGVTLHPSLGLRGTPQAVGSFTAKIKATNSGGSSSSEVTFNIAAVAPTEGVIVSASQVDGDVIIAYTPGQFGSDKDVITAGATDPAGLTVVVDCEKDKCIFPEGNLDEGVAYEVRVTHKNDVGEAESINSITVTPLGIAQKVTDVEVSPGVLKALVSFTPPANTADLSITHFDVAIRDNSTDVVVSQIRCGSSSCEIDVPAPDSKRKYVAEVTAVYNDSYSMSPVRSPEFSVKTLPPKPVELAFNSELKYVVAARQEFVIPVTAQGDGDVEIYVESDYDSVEFVPNPARITGALNPGTYEFPVTATDREGTTESVITIEVLPGQLPAPDFWFNFNTYDGTLGVIPHVSGLIAEAITAVKWTAQIGETTVSGECAPNKVCRLKDIPFDSEITLQVQSISDIEEPSEIVETTVFTPAQEERVAIDTATFRRMNTPDDVGIVEFAIRTPLARKFALALQAPATLQVVAETGCSRDYETYVTTYRGDTFEDCPIDPYVRVFQGDDLVAEDDDSGVRYLYDPALSEEEQLESMPITISNQYSSITSSSVEPGDYVIEVARFVDVKATNADRATVNNADVDVYVVVITTPAEADRLAALSLEAQTTTVTPQRAIDVEASAAAITLVPPTMTPQDGQASGAPQSNSKANKSGAAITGITVTTGNRALTLTPNVITAKPEVPQVKITLTPGNKSCTVAAGKACTITGLSPWLTYSAEAIVPGDASGASTSGLRPSLQLKAGSKVSVSSLGLAAAARSIKASVARRSLRASGSCSLNAAQTVLTVGATGTCSVSVRTTKTVKKKAVAGPSLTLRAAIVR